MKRMILFFCFILMLTACGISEETYNCDNCEESFIESELSLVLSYDELWYCPDCIDSNTILCPACNMLWDEDYYHYTEYHNCDIWCCSCGKDLIGIPHYIDYYCNDCAPKDWPELFCCDCGVYSENGRDLIDNHCYKCYSYMQSIILDIDFNKLKYDMSPDSFCLGFKNDMATCTSCNGHIFSFQKIYEGDICIDCVAILHPERYCVDCKQCFLPENIIDKHCLTCLFDIKSKNLY